MGHVTSRVEKGNAYRILGGKSLRKICRHRWENNIKIDLKDKTYRRE
jgi:hypothetical protein